MNIITAINLHKNTWSLYRMLARREKQLVSQLRGLLHDHRYLRKFKQVADLAGSRCAQWTATAPWHRFRKRMRALDANAMIRIGCAGWHHGAFFPYKGIAEQMARGHLKSRFAELGAQISHIERQLPPVARQFWSQNKLHNMSPFWRSELERNWLKRIRIDTAGQLEGLRSYVRYLEGHLDARAKRLLARFEPLHDELEEVQNVKNILDAIDPSIRFLDHREWKDWLLAHPEVSLPEGWSLTRTAHALAEQIFAGDLNKRLARLQERVDSIRRQLPPTAFELRSCQQRIPVSPLIPPEIVKRQLVECRQKLQSLEPRISPTERALVESHMRRWQEFFANSDTNSESWFHRPFPQMSSLAYAYYSLRFEEIFLTALDR